MVDRCDGMGHGMGMAGDGDGEGWGWCDAGVWCDVCCDVMLWRRALRRCERPAADCVGVLAGNVG